MEIVIKVPEKIYKSIQDNTYCGISNSDMYDAIRNGIPLPKGHGRLIDERHLREDMERAYKFANELVALGLAEYFLDSAQTIIEADEEVDE